MAKLTFKNTIEKDQKFKDKLKKEKYMRMRKLLGDLKTALKPNEEDDGLIDKSLAKLFNEHLPKGFLYETRIVSNEPLTIKPGNRSRAAEIETSAI